MSSYLQEMIESSDDIEAIFQEYVETKDNQKDPVIYCFFEGKDYRYYGMRINMFCDHETIPYDCKGKDNVLQLYAMIMNNTYHNNKNSTLFFIDKDFDTEEFKNDDIYKTPCYAIENFYATDSAFIEFLKGELRINRNAFNKDDKEDFDKALRLFRKTRQEFIDKIRMLNVWYSLQKNKSKDEKNKPNLMQLKECKKLRLPLNIEELKDLTPNYIAFNEIDIQNELKRLMENPVMNFRGKYYEEFLVDTISKIITDSNKPKDIFSKRRKVNLQVGKDNIISALSQYADTPKCLKEYLKRKLIVSEVASDLEVN
ncbi:DUF4435 domain-containing protein [Clostridium senegalense]